jgi:hypothetical protein
MGIMRLLGRPPFRDGSTLIDPGATLVLMRGSARESEVQVMAIDTTSPRTRRAILLGALGGAVAAGAAAVGRASPVAATNGNVVHVGGTYSATNETTINATGHLVGALVGTSKSGNAIFGHSDTRNGIWGESYSSTEAGVGGFSPSGYGVYASSSSGDGLYAQSDSGYGVYGQSSSSVSIYGSSSAPHQPAILGRSWGNSTGVLGCSGSTPPAPPAKTGVQGYANQDATAVGVKGQSPSGRGVVASGGAAQLRLVASTAASHPLSGELGDLFLDKNKRLWFCKGGTAWVKLA